MIRAAALALTLAACAQPDSGMAGCWERLPDGRPRYRADLSPMVSGWCPTWGEAVVMQDYATQARAIECNTACKLGLLLLMGLR